MPNIRAFRSSIVAAFGIVISAQAADVPPISFTVQHATVTGSGMTPDGAAAVLNVSIESSGSSSVVMRTWRDARADADGSISVTFSAPVAQGAFIAVIDVETGRIARSSAGETLFEQVALPERQFKRNPNREVDAVATPHPSAMLVVVRRAVGAWLRIAYDGGSGDADGLVDGRITTDPSAMQPIAHSPEAPAKIKPKDAVLLIDPQCLCYATTEVEP
jgi:hypothetical protein